MPTVGVEKCDESLGRTGVIVAEGVIKVYGVANARVSSSSAFDSNEGVNELQ